MGMIVSVSIFLLFTGCATSSVSGGMAGERPAELPIGEFQDVPITPGMTRDESRIVEVQTGQFQTGIGLYKGRIEPKSLAEYYKGIMPTRGWKLLADFGAKRTIQIYTKEQRVSVILIEEGWYYTHLEIRTGRFGAS
jgi:hypothetical protein